MGNTLFNNSSWAGQEYQYNLLVSGGGVRKDIQVKDNHLYCTPERGQGYNAFGQYTLGDDMEVTRNQFIGGYLPLTVERQKKFTFTGNRVYCPPGGVFAVALNSPDEVDLKKYAWDQNEYFDQGTAHFRAAKILADGTISGVTTDFQTWQKATQFDAHSKYSAAAPTGIWTYVTPNSYEPGRANITIYNFDAADSVAIDLAGACDFNGQSVVLLRGGDRYTIHDAQNFFGPPIVEAACDGSGKFTMPMTATAKSAANAGLDPGPHTDKRFGVFVLRQVAARDK